MLQSVKNKPVITALSYDDVLLVPQFSTLTSRSEVGLTTQITPRVTLKIPIISTNMTSVTGVQMAITIGKLGGLGILPRFNLIEEQAQQVATVKLAKVLVAAAVGVKPEFLDRSKALVAAGVDILVVDVAHGHMQSVIETIKTLKQKFPKIEIIAGNVATTMATKDLFLAGADCVKVDIGPGNVCTTRIVTGFGVPQITAIQNASIAAKKVHKFLICDGGIKNSGDIVKGLAAGAHAVMIGSLLAGTHESPGKIIVQNGKKFKRYSGSTSINEKQNQSQKIDHIEGTSILVPYIGPVENVIQNFCDGIRSGYSYAGAKDITQFHKKAKFIQVTPLALNESAHRFI